MTILARSVKGNEYLYAIRSAHKVSKAKAKMIADALNRIQYKIKDNEVWYVHEIDQYDQACTFAERQSFAVRQGKLKEICS